MLSVVPSKTSPFSCPKCSFSIRKRSVSFAFRRRSRRVSDEAILFCRRMAKAIEGALRQQGKELKICSHEDFPLIEIAIFVVRCTSTTFWHTPIASCLALSTICTSKTILSRWSVSAAFRRRTTIFGPIFCHVLWRTCARDYVTGLQDSE